MPSIGIKKVGPRRSARNEASSPTGASGSWLGRGQLVRHGRLVSCLMLDLRRLAAPGSCMPMDGICLHLDRPRSTLGTLLQRAAHVPMPSMGITEKTCLERLKSSISPKTNDERQTRESTGVGASSAATNRECSVHDPADRCRATPRTMIATRGRRRATSSSAFRSRTPRNRGSRTARSRGRCS